MTCVYSPKTAFCPAVNSIQVRQQASHFWSIRQRDILYTIQLLPLYATVFLLVNHVDVLHITLFDRDKEPSIPKSASLIHNYYHINVGIVYSLSRCLQLVHERLMVLGGRRSYVDRIVWCSLLPTKPTVRLDEFDSSTL